jgi:hypothetical protein
MSKPSNRILFAGPTLYALPDPLSFVPDDLRLERPVRRGDVEAAMRGSVGHREIREAIEAGWRVWGLSSMGAIRAREMRDLGMRGYGRVHDLFWSEDDFQDDEVALVHEPEPPYRAASEPLVHLRAAAAHLLAQGHLSRAAHDGILADLKSRWYGDRTLPLFHELALAAAPHDRRGGIREELQDFGRFRWKSLDLKEFLERAVWRE